MILNAIWQVPEDQQIENLTDRTIRIGTHLGEGTAWGLREDFDTPSDREQPPVLFRINSPQSVVLIAASDKPFIVELWHLDEDESLNLTWNGAEWFIDDNGPKDLDDLSETYVEVRTVDVESMVAKACYNLGLKHLNISQVRERDSFIELVDRHTLFKSSLMSGSYFYRRHDSDQCKYTCDLEELPSIDELDMLHHVVESVKDGSTIYSPETVSGHNDFIYIFYDDDLPIEIVLNSIFAKDAKYTFEHLKSLSEDIVDCVNLVKDRIIESSGTVDTNFFIVESGEKLKTYRLYFNMASFFPKEAPYLV